MKKIISMLAILSGVAGLAQCPALTGLSASNITSVSADLTWTAGTGATAQVEYGTSGFTQGTGTFVIASTNTENVTALTPVTDYQFYVRDICAVGDTSAWAGPYTFTTACPVYTPVYTESFGSYLPTCWTEMQGLLGATNTTVTNATSSSWTSDGFANVGTAGSAKINLYGTGRDEWMVSPTIDLGSGATAYQVEFDIALTDYASTAATVLGSDDTIAFVISTDNGVTWSTANILQIWEQGTEPSHTGDFIAIDLSAYTGLVQFGFYAASSVSNEDNDVFVDNFNVLPIPTCAKPLNLAVSNVVYDGADVSWTTGAANVEIEYGPAGFTPGSGTSVLTSSNPHSLTSLTDQTDYEFYIRDICGVGDTSLWSGPVAFTTPCGPFTPVYTENFSSYIPTCWVEMQGVLGAVNTTFTNTTSSNWTNDGFANNGTTGAARMEIYSTGRDEWLISPTIDLGSGATAYQVEFDVALTNWSSTAAATLGADDTLACVISTDNGVTWSTANILQVWEQGSEPSNTGDFIAIDLSAYTGLVKFGFYAASSVSGGDVNVYIDNFSVLPIPTCPKPQNLAASNILYNSVDVSWTTGAANVEIEYGPAGFTPGAGTSILTSSNPHTISTLTGQTDYEFYIRDICGAGDTSLWSGPIAFTTPCGPFTPVYNEDFSSYVPTCWSEMQGLLGATNTTVTNATSSSWTSDGFANSGTTGSAKINLYGTGRDEWLVSPTIDLGSGAIAYQVEFDIALTDYASTASTVLGVDDTVAVVISTDNGVTWSLANVLQMWEQGSEPSHTGDFIAIDLSAYTGLVKFGFYAASSVSNEDNDLFIDNFQVREIPNCPQPLGLTVDALTSTSADISWTVGAADSHIEYGPAGFTQGTGTIISSTTGTANITGLTPVTGYDFYVMDSCGVGNVSSWTGPVSFTTDCPNYSPTYTENFDTYIPVCWSEMQGILGVSNTTITNTSSSNWTNDGFANVGSTGSAKINLYSTGRDEWMVSPTIDLGSGATAYQVEFDIALTDYASTAATVLGIDDTIAFVISTDNGVTWSQANILQLWEAGSEPSHTGDFIAIDLSAYTGLVQFGFYAASSVSNEDNDVFVDNFQVLPIPTCPKPLNLSVSNVTHNSADANWTTGAADVEIEYGPAGFTPGTGTAVLTSSNPYNMSSLTDQTDYEFYIRDICAPGDTSLWSGPVSFTTPCSPFVPVYTEDFTNFVPACWSEMQGVLGMTNTVITDAGSSNWGTDVFANTGSDDAAYINLYSTGRDEWLVSPTIDLGSGATEYHLEFDIALTDYASTAATTLGVDDTVAIVISTDNGNTWTTANILRSWTEGNEPSNTGDYVGMSLSGYTGLVKFGFYAASSVSNADNDVFIDNFEIKPCVTTYNTINETVCDSYTAPSGMVYTASGMYNDTIMNSIGCDSVITINLTVNNATASTVNITECESYTGPSGMVYNASGTYYDTIPNTVGCDSVITVNLTINNTTANITETACDTYTSPSGVMYTTSGIYNDTIANAAGCDSIMTIDLTINQSYSNTITVVECDTFTSPGGVEYTTSGTYMESFTNAAGCDSVLTYEVTINDSYETTIDVTGCFEYISDGGTTYTTSGTYVESYTNVAGCDSVITLNVTINDIDLTVTQVNGVELTSNEAAPTATYQWVDCDDSNAPIPGATSITYVATANGNYACEVTLNGCTDISECKIVDNVGFDKVDDSDVKIYPNPNNGNFVIESMTVEAGAQIQISNSAGQIVYQGLINSQKNMIDISDVESGVYVVNILTANTNTKRILIIE